MNSDFSAELSERKCAVESALKKIVPPQNKPHLLYESMYYSLFANAKRIRAIMLIAGCELNCGNLNDANNLACAVEMIHAYSLIHDDLPCMDNDNLRRGQPTNHIKYGYAQALLAGDALLNLAYETVLNGYEKAVDKQRYINAAILLAKSAGCCGMVGGQWVDIDNTNGASTIEELNFINRNKTGALLYASLTAGYILGENRENSKKVEEYAYAIGEMFQLVDDVIDIYGNTEKTGKTHASDEKNNKATYPSLLGIDETKKHIEKLMEKCLASMSVFGEKGRFLSDFAVYLASRDN